MDAGAGATVTGFLACWVGALREHHTHTHSAKEDHRRRVENLQRCSGFQLKHDHSGS